MFPFKCSLLGQHIISVLLIFVFSGCVFAEAARKLNTSSPALETMTVARSIPYNVPILINKNKNNHGKQSFLTGVPRTTPRSSNRATKNNFKRRKSTKLPNKNSSNLPNTVPFQPAKLFPPQAYNKSEYNKKKTNKYSSLYNEHRRNRQPYRLDLPMSTPSSQITAQGHYNSASGFHPNVPQYSYALPQQQLRKHENEQEEEEEESFEIEDKVFSKTVVATKALKVGKILFTFFMVVIVLILAGLGKIGLTFSPVVLPLALIPLGVIALLLFIPLFVLFVPLAATGAIGERRKRRRRRRNVDQFTAENSLKEFLGVLQDQMPRILENIQVPAWED